MCAICNWRCTTFSQGVSELLCLLGWSTNSIYLAYRRKALNCETIHNPDQHFSQSYWRNLITQFLLNEPHPVSFYKLVRVGTPSDVGTVEVRPIRGGTVSDPVEPLRQNLLSVYFFPEHVDYSFQRSLNLFSLAAAESWCICTTAGCAQQWEPCR